MKYDQFTTRDKLNIYNALVLFIAMVVVVTVAVLPFTSYYGHDRILKAEEAPERYPSKWLYALIVVFIGCFLITYYSYKKYKMVQTEKIVSFSRAVVWDTLFAFVGFLIHWIAFYIPIPFSWSEFFFPKPSLEFQFGTMTIAYLFLIPTLLTNKKIQKNSIIFAGKKGNRYT